MQYFPIHQYVHNFWKIYILGHLTPCVYQFIGGDTEEKSNIIFISWIGTVYWNTILCWTFFCMYGSWVTTQKKNLKWGFYLTIQIQKYFLEVLYSWKFEYFHKKDIPLFLIVADKFASYHRIFIIFPHLEWCYAQCNTLFYFHAILIHGHLIETQMDLIIIILTVIYLSNMELIY